MTIAERNNKPYFVALDGGAQTPLFDTIERNKIKILLRSRRIYVIIDTGKGLPNGQTLFNILCTANRPWGFDLFLLLIIASL